MSFAIKTYDPPLPAHVQCVHQPILEQINGRDRLHIGGDVIQWCPMHMGRTPKLIRIHKAHFPVRFDNAATLQRRNAIITKTYRG